MDITNQIKTLTTSDVNPAGVANVVNNKSGAKEETAQTVNVETIEKTEAALASAVSDINDHIQNVQRSIQFTVDEASSKDIVTVLDKETKEIIRQFPSDEVLAFARRLAEQNGDELIQLFKSKA